MARVCAPTHMGDSVRHCTDCAAGRRFRFAMLHLGFGVDLVVHGYGDVCQAMAQARNLASN
jgi:hypothetical protein